jgi:hypothetical protein
MLHEAEDLHYSLEQATALLRYLLGNWVNSSVQIVLKYQDPVEESMLYQNEVCGQSKNVLQARTT